MEKTSRRSRRRSIKAIAVFAAIVILAILLESQITWSTIKRSAQRSTTLLLNQIETVLDENAREEEEETDELKEDYISHARSIAYILSAKPEAESDIDELKTIASLEGVDEINIFDGTGTIISGTVPEYYGFSFDSGEQMGYFKPMLQDKTLAMCQDVTPNTAEGKSMMYAIAWNQEGTRMIQAGIEPKRLLERLKENEIGSVISGIPITEGFSIYAVDPETGIVAAATDESAVGTAVPYSILETIGSKETPSWQGIIRSGGQRYYCNYTRFGSYIIAVAFNTSASSQSMQTSVLVIAVYTILAGAVILFLFLKLYRAGDEKDSHLRQLSEYSRVMASAGFGLWHIYLKGGAAPRMQANDKMMQLLGVEGGDLTEEQMYDAWYDRIMPEAIPSVQKSVGEMMDGRFSENTYRWEHPTKDVIWVRCGGTAERLPDGTNMLSGYHAEVTDIVLKEQKRRRALEDTVSRMTEDEDIIRAAGHGIWRFSLDGSGRICGMTVNEEWKRIYGAEGRDMDRKECLDYFVNGLVDPSTSPTQFDYSALDQQTAIHVTFAWRHPAKGVIYIAIGGAKHVTAEGEIQISGYAEDVTEQTLAKQKYEQALMDARDAAEAANRSKTAFLFSMSHDIRTPMNAIIGYTDLVQKHYGDREKCMDYLRKTQQANSFLLSLINNVLEMARIESGKSELDETAVPLGDITGEMRDMFEEQMRAKGIGFRVTEDVHTPYILCDKPKVHEICLNILSNAYKYTPEGGSVNVELKELPCDRQGYARTRLTIADTGIGMTPEFLPHLFEEFSRERTATESRVQGTGLGMPIVKKLVDLMGGTIDVKSEPGRGTVFTVEITFRAAESLPGEQSGEAAAFDPEKFAGKRILLAEDNDLNAEIAMEILGEAGFAVDRAEDGVICVDMLLKAPAGTYDVILMDIQMPNLNGYEATARIRALDDPARSGIPIIAMTANAFESDRQDALRAGMNGHVTKPVEIAKLMETLAKVLK